MHRVIWNRSTHFIIPPSFSFSTTASLKPTQQKQTHPGQGVDFGRVLPICRHALEPFFLYNHQFCYLVCHPSLAPYRTLLPPARRGRRSVSSDNKLPHPELSAHSHGSASWLLQSHGWPMTHVIRSKPSLNPPKHLYLSLRTRNTA